MKANGNRRKPWRGEKARMAAYFRGRLLERRQETLLRLRKELASLEEGANGSSGDFADMASSCTDRETLYGIGTVESDALSRIDYALRRIEEGTYGLCEECGDRIPRVRLRALPFASLCVPCQRREEAANSESERSAATWRAEDDHDLEEHAEAAVLRAGRPGG